jgi:uncharacterized protein YggE
MIKKLVLASIVVMCSFATQAAELPAYPFIHVSGSALVYVMPDMGEIDFEIAAQDADPAAALQLVTTRVAEVRALLQEAGVDSGSLEIRDMRKEMKKNEGGAPSYDIRCGVKVTLKDLSKWKAVVGPLLVKPNLDGFMTVLDTSERSKVELTLMTDAIKDARAKADTVAAGFGRKLGMVGGVSPGELKNLTRAMNLAPSEYYQRTKKGDENTADRTELLAVNLLKLGQSVDVIFKIK